MGFRYNSPSTKKVKIDKQECIRKSSEFIKNEKIIKSESNNEKFLDLIKKMTLLLDTVRSNPNFTNKLSNLKKEDKILNGKINNAVIFFEIDNLRKDAEELYSTIKEKNTNLSTIETNKQIKLSSDRRAAIYMKFFEVCSNSLYEISSMIKGEYCSKDNIPSHHILMNLNFNVNTINNISKIDNTKDLTRLLTKSRFNVDDTEFNTGENECSGISMPSSNIRYVNKPKECNMDFRNLNSKRSKSVFVKKIIPAKYIYLTKQTKH
jgi:hypothetical protein